MRKDGGPEEPAPRRELPDTQILKLGPCLDPENLLARWLGPTYDVTEIDPSQPLLDQVAGAEVLLVRDRPLPEGVIAAAPRLRLIQLLAPGDGCPGLPVAADRGVSVCAIPSNMANYARSVAEHAYYLMLAVSKMLRGAELAMAAGLWGQPLTYSLDGKTLGLVGIGRSGRLLIPMARALGMRVIAVKQDAGENARKALDVNWLGGMAELEHLLAQSDVVSIHLPLTPETRGLIGAKAVAAMKDGALLIHTAPDAVVDREALYQGLTSGKLGGAGRDLTREDPDDPLLQLGNVIATPGQAGLTRESSAEALQVAAENIRRVGLGLAPLHNLSMGVFR